jgi:hypothetical protein
MPKTMRINHTIPRRKIKDLQTHRHDNPCHNQTRPRCPKAVDFSVTVYGIAGPKEVLCDADNDIGSHVICIIPGPETQVRNMEYVERDTQARPQPQKRSRPRAMRVLRVVETKDAYRGVIHAIHNTRSSSEIIQFLSQWIIPCMENHAEYPTCETKVCEYDVVFSERVGGWY